MQSQCDEPDLPDEFESVASAGALFGNREFVSLKEQRLEDFEAAR